MSIHLFYLNKNRPVSWGPIIFVETSCSIIDSVGNTPSNTQNIFYYLIKWVLLVFYYICKALLFLFCYLAYAVTYLSYRLAVFLFKSIFSALKGLWSAIYAILSDISLSSKILFFAALPYIYRGLDVAFNAYKAYNQMILMFSLHPVLTGSSAAVLIISFMILFSTSFFVKDDKRRRFFILLSLSVISLCLSSLVATLVFSDGIGLYIAVVVKIVFMESILIPVTVLYYRNVDFEDMPKEMVDLLVYVYKKLTSLTFH